MFEIETYGNFKPLGKQKVKKQIILSHTSREVEEYLTSLTLRHNSKYDRIPNFVITRSGKVFQLLSEIGYSNYLYVQNWNRNSVVLCLENLGWLEKKPLTESYINWKGSIYNEKVFEKKWREYFFWQPYTQKQIEATANLCNIITKSLGIKKRTIGHNTKIDGIERYEGIVSRSNFDSSYTDLNPSFTFEIFEKLLENEQFTQRQI